MSVPYVSVATLHTVVGFAMIPKSTTKLRPGDICLIQRTDGKSVAFTFLGSVSGKRSYFYGALLSPAFIGDSIPSLPERLEIDSQAMVHIKCFAENDTPIVGNAKENIGSGKLETAMQACIDMSVGTVHSVWGHKTIVRRAAAI